ncbi:MAG: succinate dehydrogenase cytochrome b subunit [Bacteroidota bacterium]|nr:succinate dehydrogenase cytochrome b subunit [Bacteroidota bacterium]
MNLIQSSIGRKILMALSGFFLMFFLLQHLTINFLSVISSDLFNSVSHFMGTNFLIQFILQPLLLFGFIFHLIMGIYLEIQNNRSRPKLYFKDKNRFNSAWISRNMIITGVMILLFLGLHFYDFWVPEINYKYVLNLPEDPNRYYIELTHKFDNFYRVAIYCLSFVFLSLHLLHGFKSSFQSIGMNKKSRNSIIEKSTFIYSIIVPGGFIFIAIFHYLKSTV